MEQTPSTPPVSAPEAQPTNPAPASPPSTPQPQAISASDTKKLIGILGYIIPILFFLPLVMDNLKNDVSAKFHANQQLNLLLFWIIGNIVSGLLVMAFIGLLLAPLVTLAGLAFMIIGVINVAKGAMKPLPVIGGFTLLH